MHQHSLPALPQGASPSDLVQARVRENHNYGGAPAGTLLRVRAADWQQAHRSLELVKEAEDPTPATPRSCVISIPAGTARSLNLDVAPGAALGTYEVMPWPADAEARGMLRREDLERALQAKPEGTEEIEAFAGIFGWEDKDEDGDAAAWIKQRLPELKLHFRTAQSDLERLRADLAQARADAAQDIERTRQECARAMSQARDVALAELEQSKVQAAEQLAAKDAELAAAREEIAKLRAEIERMEAVPAPERPAQVAVKGKKAE